MELFLRGFVIGVSIAAPVGPIGIICIRRSLIDGWKIGLSAGLGAAVADFCYAVIAVIGLSAVTQLFTAANPILHIGGGLLLLWIGFKMFRSRPADPLAVDQLAAGKKESGLRVLLETFFLTVTNPMTILSFSAVLTAFGVERFSSSALYVVSGVFVGSAAWWCLLSAGVSRFHRSVGPSAMRGINYCSGIVITAFALWSLFTTGR